MPRQPLEWGNGLCAKRDANVDVDPPTFALSQPVVRAITVTAIAPPPRNGSASGALTASTSASPNDLVHLGGFAAGLVCQLRSVSGFPARPAVRAINCGPYFNYSGALARGLARFDRFRVAQRDGPLPVASLVSDDRILDASVFH